MINIHYDNESLPKLYRIKRTWKSQVIEDPDPVVAAGIAQYKDRIKPGMRIAVCAGSRGIYNYKRIIKSIVDAVKSYGAQPYIIPAMGSHGGATAEGQVEMLNGYGITEEYTGAPILSSMETVVLGKVTENTNVYLDKNAYGMDGIIMCNRVKVHTDFSGEIESGLCKQCVIGLGKQKGASSIHRNGIYGLKHLIPKASKIIKEKAPILMGIAILENFQDKTAKLEVVPAENFLTREPELLIESKKLMPSLPTLDLDVLVIQEMGKNISGTGMDPNIIGRYGIRANKDVENGPRSVAVLDLTDESHHNALGVGMADVISQKLWEKIDFVPTYMNTLTSGFLTRCAIPCVADSDKQAVIIAMNSCNRIVTPDSIRMIFARNSLQIVDLVVSEALLPELRQMEDVEILDEVQPQWDEKDNLVPFF